MGWAAITHEENYHKRLGSVVVYDSLVWFLASSIIPRVPECWSAILFSSAKILRGVQEEFSFLLLGISVITHCGRVVVALVPPPLLFCFILVVFACPDVSLLSEHEL